MQVLNAKHINCLDKRFRNSFEDLQTSFLLKEKEWYSTAESTQESIEAGSIFSLCSQLIYGDKETAEAIKELLTKHVSADDFCEVYKQFVDVEAYIPKDEYSAVTALSDEKKREQKIASLAEKAFEKHLTDWKALTDGDFIAIASVYNIQVFVLKNTDKKLFLPICGNYMFVYKSPFVFQQIATSLFKGGLKDRECPCLTDVPKLLGNFPIIDNDIDLHRIKKLDLISCCPSKRRHFRHRHFQHLVPEIDGKMSESVGDSYCHPSEDIKKIIEIMAEERKKLDAIDGGGGTLEKCIRKEIYGKENVNLPISLPHDDPEKALQMITDWTGVPVYVFRCSGSEYRWVLFQPSKHNSARNSKCRYYITILFNSQSGGYDRLISKSGCNCLQVPPYVAPMSGDQRKDSGVPREEKHWPLVTFFPEKPKDELFSDDERREIKVIPMYSEMLLITERKDMDHRLLEGMSDHTHSLYRCISKEIFGNEESYSMILAEILAEIRDNPDIYGSLLMQEKENTDSELLSNFKYRKHRTFDFLRFNSTIVKESADFFADRIEDGFNLGDLEIFAVATRFQVPVYVLSANIQENKMETEWKLFTQVARKKLPTDFQTRRQYLAGGNAIHRCLFDSTSGSKYYVALYRSSSGQFYRLAPRNCICNCQMNPPENFVIEHKRHKEQDYRLCFDMTTVKNKLTISKLELDNWLRCNMALEILCTKIIDEFEGRRRNVNITNIVGSSVGIVGSALAIAGVATAPYTFGVSLGLVVAGSVVSGLGGVTIIGANYRELVLNRKSIPILERYQMNLRKRSRCFEKSLLDLEKKMENFATQDAVDNRATAVQTGTGTLRTLGLLPTVIARIITRAVSMVNVAIPILSLVLDFGVLGFNIYNLVKGSKTNVTERLRAVRSVLRTTRMQMFIWGYGNQEEYVQSVEKIHPKRS